MTNAQLSKALALAQSKQSLQHEDIEQFDGFGLPDFRPITCTIPQLARLVRWQCLRWNGTVDAERSTKSPSADGGSSRCWTRSSRNAVAARPLRRMFRSTTAAARRLAAMACGD